jgi:hypothetical protein
MAAEGSLQLPETVLDRCNKATAPFGNMCNLQGLTIAGGGRGVPSESH